MKLSGFKLLAAMCTAAVALNSGCDMGGDSSGVSLSDESSDIIVEQSSAAGESGSAITPDTISDKEAAPADEWDCSIVFSEGSLSVDGIGAHASGTQAVITKAGTYRITGECSDGSILVNAGGDDKVTLLLDGVSLGSKTGCVIRCENADRLTVSLAEGSVNSVIDAAAYSDTAEDSPDAAIFSRDDLVFNGEGTLRVTANYKDGIKCKDSLKISGGNIEVTSVDDGIVGKDYLLIGGGALTLNTAGDALKSTNDTDAGMGYISVTGGEISITADGDAAHAVSELFVSGGSISAVTGGGSATVEHSSSGGWGGGHGGGFFQKGDIFDFDSLTDDSGSSAGSMKGLKADGGITVSGGALQLDCADDTLHAGGDLLISGGVLTLASGDDGLHADGAIVISDGEISNTKSYEAIEALTIDIDGGVVNAVASDDGINAAGGDNGAAMGFGGDASKYYFSMTGGEVTLNAAGDGVDSNGTAALSGGTLTVFGPENGANGALDYENSFAVNGGTLIALGSRQMAMAPSTLSQPCISVYSSVSADTLIEVLDESGNAIISVTTPKTCDSLIFSSDRMSAGSVYSVTADGVVLAEVEAGDGVSGGGAAGDGFGGWGDFGGMGGGFGGGQHHGRGERSDMAVEGATAPADGAEPPQKPESTTTA